MRVLIYSWLLRQRLQRHSSWPLRHVCCQPNVSAHKQTKRAAAHSCCCCRARSANSSMCCASADSGGAAKNSSRCALSMRRTSVDCCQTLRGAATQRDDSQQQWRQNRQAIAQKRCPLRTSMSATETQHQNAPLTDVILPTGQ